MPLLVTTLCSLDHCRGIPSQTMARSCSADKSGEAQHPDQGLTGAMVTGSMGAIDGNQPGQDATATEPTCTDGLGRAADSV